MVGRRHNLRTANGHAEQRYDDIETGRKKPTAARFRDAAHVSLIDRRREELKKKLKEGIDREWLHKYRKSPEEVGIGTKVDPGKKF